jgi:purine-nucleoside phosphorylase
VIPRPSLHIPTTKVVPVQDYDRTKLVGRDAGPNTDSQAHYSTICSDNAVIKDATRRDQLTRDLRMMCVEMEVAGLMARSNFSCSELPSHC